VDFRPVAPQAIQDRGRLPDKDARVPVEPARGQVFPGGLCVGLFAEAAHLKGRRRGRGRGLCFARGTGRCIGHLRARLGRHRSVRRVRLGIERLAALDIAERLRRIARADAERNQTPGVLIDQRCGEAHGAAELGRRANQVIGRHNGHGGLGIAALKPQRSQSDAGGRVAPERFDEYPFGRQFGKLPGNAFGQTLGGSHHHALACHQPGEPIHGLPQHGLRSHQAQELFGTVGPALGPEACAASAGHDYGVQHVTKLLNLSHAAPESGRSRKWPAAPVRRVSPRACSAEGRVSPDSRPAG